MRPFPLFDRYRQDQNGATAIEYALISMIITLALVGIMGTTGAVEAIYEQLMAIVAAMKGSSDGGG